MRALCRSLKWSSPWRRAFSSSFPRREIKDIAQLPGRTCPSYVDLLSLQWPLPPKNILLVQKDGVQSVTDSLIEFARHIHKNYPVSILLEPGTASSLHQHLPFPVYTSTSSQAPLISSKTDLVTTFGGDGTILRASSLFSHSASVPPVLSFSLGSLGFLSEWHFRDYEHAFDNVYQSGLRMASQPGYPDQSGDLQSPAPSRKAAQILLRHRLRVTIQDEKGLSSSHQDTIMQAPYFALNELILHRGAAPHLTHIDIGVGGRHLTAAVADGMIVSSPTGSTAYSLSSGGSIIHPLVASLLLTPICPRSLSFRPLVLPANTPVTLTLSERNRAREVELSVDGQRTSGGLRVGMEVQVEGEQIIRSRTGWSGGVPCIMRVGGGLETGGDEGWVRGLNGLLKFNYPFGEESGD